jgi:hypothetical protein
MGKLRLDPETLLVETFRAEEDAVRMRGTVEGAQRTWTDPAITLDAGCDTGGFTVITCPTGCSGCDTGTDTSTIFTGPSGCTGCPPCGYPTEWGCETIDCTVTADQAG